MRYSDTPISWIRAAYEITEPDQAEVLQRAYEIRQQAEVAGKQISRESSEAAAAAQLTPRTLIVTTDDEWNRRMRNTYPYWEQDGKMSLDDGVCWTTTGPDGEIVWHGGSPQMRTAVAESRRIADERERAALADPVAVRIR